ncbi:MAG TPA: DNA-processing protein DprA [Woeseiaceae bacterium]|nr:DNA-processing protein DprA [Woeseiaceae bacterium]
MQDPEPAVDENEWLQQQNHHRIRLGDDAYPELLAGIPGPPERLYVVGDPEILHLPALAIVGSRNPTSGGAQNAFEFARHLGRTGFCIVSGLAQGIDAAAHRGALAAEAPTVAFLGHGIDRVYPATNHDLARDIARHGALVSEFPLGTAPNRALFPQRNRLISGLSLGTLVVEAARRSGSLITARLASEQGREVFAIPGSIHNPLTRGCHQLIRQGAKLVEAADDIVAELAPLAGHMLQTVDTAVSPRDAGAEADEEYVKLLEAIGHDPVSTDQIVERSGLTIDQVSSMLLILELEGKVEKLSGGRYSVLS